ncbi:DUF5007 domain-containing protein [Olivibacter sitiensis]|uniref:DUF5007 domain-containing protein n=1 Tax=Olivibacter sitiensis TaxID=376470 RepID=UPI0004159B42|nr:DUF5007 domain-containing protein [Olivibacter sitiensis]
MKRNYKIALGLTLVTLVTAIACKKVPDGFLSQYIRYEEFPIAVAQGRASVSSALNLDGSGKPVTVKLLHVYNKETGANVDDLFAQTYNVPVWTGLYDPQIDTTLDLINAKRTYQDLPPIVINEYSGQLEANMGTLNVPTGSYQFDLEISNPAGTNIYSRIGEFELSSAPTYEIPAARSTVAMMVGAESTTKTLPAGEISVERIGEEDKIIVRIVDKNGTPFNPAAGEIARRPNSGTAGGYLQTMQDYSLSYQTFDDRMEFIYGVVPFPLNSLGNGFNYYYRIPTQYVHFDESLDIADDTYSCNARFSFRAYYPGTYEITVTVLGVAHR